MELIHKLHIDEWFNYKVSGVLLKNNMFIVTRNNVEQKIGNYDIDTMQSLWVFPMMFHPFPYIPGRV